MADPDMGRRIHDAFGIREEGNDGAHRASQPHGRRMEDCEAGGEGGGGCRTLGGERLEASGMGVGVHTEPLP